jgi:hypothetical protein
MKRKALTWLGQEQRDVSFQLVLVADAHRRQGAAHHRGGDLRRSAIEDLAAAAAPLVITLRQEVWDSLLMIRALRARPTRRRFADLYGDAYAVHRGRRALRSR